MTFRLEYIEMDDTDEFSSARSRNSIYYASNKIKMKAALALIRVIMLYIFFYLDNKNMTVFLSNLVAFLLAHEALVISNFILMSGYFIFNRIMNRTNTLLPSFFLYLDILNNM